MAPGFSLSMEVVPAPESLTLKRARRWCTPPADSGPVDRNPLPGRHSSYTAASAPRKRPF